MVKLWELVDEINAGKWREFAPLLPVLVPQPDETLLRHERELILQEADAQKRADLLACAVTIGARYFATDFLWRFFREEVKIMKESIFFEEWLKEAEAKGTQQGVQQGRLLGQQGMLRRVIRRRFGTLPAALEELLPVLTEVQLQALMDIAVDAPDIQALEHAARQLIVVPTQSAPSLASSPAP